MAKMNWKRVQDENRARVHGSEQIAPKAGHTKGPDPNCAGERCGICGKKAVLRTSRYGNFLGCSDYPNCTAISNVSSDGRTALGKWKVSGQPSVSAPRPPRRLNPDSVPPAKVTASAIATSNIDANQDREE